MLGDLVELDASIYGGAHAALLLARLLGLFAQLAWQAIAAEPLLALAAAGIGVLLLLDNKDEALRRMRVIRAAIVDHGNRLLDASAPAMQRREQREGELASRLERPMLPRSIESICARQLATQRLPGTTDALLTACESTDSPVTKTRLARFLREHPSFIALPDHRWELGELGRATIDGTIGVEDGGQGEMVDRDG